MDAISLMNDKIHKIIVILMPILSASIGYMFIGWEKMPSISIIPLITFISGNIITLAILLHGYKPKNLGFNSFDAAQILSENGQYKDSIILLKQQYTIGIIEASMVQNQQIMLQRSRSLNNGLTLFAATCIVSTVLFTITLVMNTIYQNIINPGIIIAI